MKKPIALFIASTMVLSAAVGIPQEIFPSLDMGNMFSVNVSAEAVKSGTCGENATWSLYADGTLAIEGTGAMADYSKCAEQPWYRNPNVISDDPIITKAVIGPGITYIGAYAFAGIGTLTSADIAGDSLTAIGHNAFGGCASLGTVALPGSLTKIDYEAFYNCQSMTELVIPESVKYVGYSAFAYCKSIKRMTIPVVGVEYVPDNYDRSVFYQSNSIYSCTLTGNGPMSGSVKTPIRSTWIGELIVSDGITSLYSGLASECDSLTTVRLPEGITAIPKDCFRNCRHLVTINMPKTLTTIGEGAFEGARFSYMILPENLQAIEAAAFLGCGHLQAIIIPESVTSIGSAAFMGCSAFNHIHIPSNRTAAQYTGTPLPDEEEYYFHFNEDGTCTSGGYCPFVQMNREKNLNNFVERLYTKMLGRASEEAGKADWVNKLKNGATATEVSSGFVLSEELAQKNLSNTEFVTRMYRTFMDREPDAAGLADWVNALDSGCSYAFVLNSFVLSAEFGKICNTYGIETGRYEITEPRDVSRNLTAFTSRMYTKALGRQYEVGGLNDWTGRYINREISLNDMAYGFIFSEEFVNRNLSNEQYVDTLYATFFDRAPDVTGKADWLGQLNSGSATREQVLNGFLGAEEFGNLVDSFGLN